MQKKMDQQCHCEEAAELAPGVCSLAFLPGDAAISILTIRKPFIFLEIGRVGLAPPFFYLGFSL